MLGKAIFLSCLSFSLCQNLLLQRTLPGRLSHHSKTVTDGVSTVHRHDTRHHNLATNPRVQLVQQSSRIQQEEPVLLQHADGRFFALNANLEAGQFFQTADGRIFTLAAAGSSAANNNAEVLSRDASTDTAEDAEETAVAADEVTRQADNSRQQPASSPSLFRNVAVQSLNTPQFRVTNAPVHTSHFVRNVNAPVSHVSHLEHSVASAAPVFVSARAPVAQVSHLEHSVAANTPTFISARAPIAHVSHFDHAVAQPQFVSASPHTFTAHHVAAAPNVVRTANLGHQLADSGTSVFQGYYSFPSAGIDFNF